MPLAPKQQYKSGTISNSKAEHCQPKDRKSHPITMAFGRMHYSTMPVLLNTGHIGIASKAPRNSADNGLSSVA